MEVRNKITYLYKGKEVANGVIYIDNSQGVGILIHKYLNPKTNKYVKFTTFAKESGVDEHIIELIKRSYLDSTSKEVLELNKYVKIHLFDRDEFEVSIALAEDEELISTHKINELFQYYVKKNKTGEIKICSWCVDYTGYNDVDAQLAAIGYTLKEKAFDEVKKKWQERYNEAYEFAKTLIENEDIDEICIKSKTPTEEKPVLEKVVLAVKKPVHTIPTYKYRTPKGVVLTTQESFVNCDQIIKKEDKWERLHISI